MVFLNPRPLPCLKDFALDLFRGRGRLDGSSPGLTVATPAVRLQGFKVVNMCYEEPTDKRDSFVVQPTNTTRDRGNPCTRKAQAKAGWLLARAFWGRMSAVSKGPGFSFNRHNSCALENLFVPPDSVNFTLTETDDSPGRRRGEDGRNFSRMKIRVRRLNDAVSR